jgi:hypoxanthine phosphoribosyltransferase
MEILVGHVKNKVCSNASLLYPLKYGVQIAILIDDMCDTGETLALAAQTLIAAGAHKVYAIVSHGNATGLWMSGKLIGIRPFIWTCHQDDLSAANRKASGAKGSPSAIIV